MLFIKASILLTLIYSSYSKETPTVLVNRFGQVKGHYRTSQSGKTYKAYEGIPFALPPIGNRRFEPPKPINFWQGEINATKRTKHCLGFQRDAKIVSERIDGVEDCLYLNIYVPTSIPKEPYPVIFFIYGGGYQHGSLTGNEQEYLIDYDIIFVSINHRHGILGFLSTEDDVVTGNMGLKDMALALKWVNENILYFNGDPKKITVSGYASGAASIHYFFLSPMTTGLFRFAISFSGTAFNSIAQSENALGKAIRLAKMMNCPTNNTRKMIGCLKQISARKLIAAEPEFMPWNFNQFAPFGPVVEKKSPQPFIDRSPIEIISSGDVYDVPWMTGVVGQEGLYPIASLIPNNSAFTDLNENWNTIAPHLFQYEYKVPKKDYTTVAEKIRNHYFGNKSIDESFGNVERLVDAVGDRIFRFNAEKAARAMAKVNKSPVWFYINNYRANQSYSDYLSDTKTNYGVCHTDDVYLIMGNPYINVKRNKNDWQVHSQLTKAWVSVIHKGKVDQNSIHSKWKPVNATKKEFNYIRVTSQGTLEAESTDGLFNKYFWNTVGLNENKLP